MSKDEALKMLKHHKNEFENQLNTKIKVIKNDRGGVYEALSYEFSFRNGIIHQTIAFYSP
jgi:hypothetical protein